MNGSEATGGRWRMPSTYYEFSMSLPGGADTVQFIMLDTEALIGGTNPLPEVMPVLSYPPGPPLQGAAGAAPAPRRGGLRGQRRRQRRQRAAMSRRALRSSGARALAQSSSDALASDTFTPPPVDGVQWTWLEATLLSSVADWIIVVGHHPVWSVGAYGPTWPLVERLIPLLDNAGVALYFSAHEYSMAHFRSEPHLTGVDYVVAGNGAYAAGAGNGSSAVNAHADDVIVGSLQFSYAESTGFGVMRLTGGSAAALSQLSVTLYDASGAQLYDFYKDNPRTQPGHSAGNLGAPPAPAGGPGGGPAAPESKAAHATKLVLGVALAGAIGSLAVARAFSEERRAKARADAARAGAGGGGGGGGGGGAAKAGAGAAAAAAARAAAPAAAAAGAGERTPLVNVQMTPQRVRAGTSRVQKFAA
jgi:hypothetical protein